MESGSGPGSLPGAPGGTPLDSRAENLRVLKAVETSGFDRHKIDYSCRSEPRARLQIAFNIKNLEDPLSSRAPGFTSGVLVS
jgi:hypothetical protein